jgi:hypothetical protein
MIVEQFGLAMIPRCVAIWSGLISGTTSGTSGCIRNAELLSTTTAPWATAFGPHSLLTEPPAENSASSAPRSASSDSASTGTLSPWNGSRLPALRGEARSRSVRTGKLRFSSTFKNSAPTAPVAPTIATCLGLALMTSSSPCGPTTRSCRRTCGAEHALDRDAALDALAHVVERQRRDAGRGHGLHLHAGRATQVTWLSTRNESLPSAEISTPTELSDSGWQRGIRRGVSLAAMIPAIRATASTSPFRPFCEHGLARGLAEPDHGLGAGHADRRGLRRDVHHAYLSLRVQMCRA